MLKFFTKELNNKGFTLIELIVVIAIIAILAAIAIPRFTGFTESAKESADEATAKTIENAIMMYIAQGGEVSVTDKMKNGNFEDTGLEDLLGDVGAPQQGGTWEIKIDGNDVNVLAPHQQVPSN